MNWDQIAGNWKQVKGVARERWGKLTDDDVDVIAGKEIYSSARYKKNTASHRKRRKRNSRLGKLL